MKRFAWMSPLLVGVLAACGQTQPLGNPGPKPQPGGPTATVAEMASASKSFDAGAGPVRQALSSGMSNYLANLGAEPYFSLDLAQFIGLPSFLSELGNVVGLQPSLPKAQGVRAQAETGLPRGSWDCTSGSCQAATADDYYVKWKTPSGETVELLLDWDASSLGTPSPTVLGHFPPDLEVYETPTHLTGWVKLGGVTLMTLNRRASYPDSGCVAGRKALGTPDSAVLSAVFGTPGGPPLLEIKNLEWNVGPNGLSSKGEVSANASGQTLAGAWEFVLVGSVLRSGCNQFSAILANNLKGSATLSAGGQTFEIGLEADRFSQNPSAIRGQGVAKFGGKTVEFKGTLEDSDKNCIPGENLTLSFAGGEALTLEQYLKTHHGAKPCG